MSKKVKSMIENIMTTMIKRASTTELLLPETNREIVKSTLFKKDPRRLFSKWTKSFKKRLPKALV